MFVFTGGGLFDITYCFSVINLHHIRPS